MTRETTTASVQDGCTALDQGETPEQARVAFGILEATINTLAPTERHRQRELAQVHIEQAGFERICSGEGSAMVLSPSTGDLWMDGEVIASLGRSRLLFRLLEFTLIKGSKYDKQTLFSDVWDQLYLAESSDNSLYVALNRLRRKLTRPGLVIGPTALGGFAFSPQPPVYRWSPPSMQEPPEQPSQTTNLNPFANKSFGREDAIAEILRAVEGGVGTVSIVGPGGTGKTRLARWIGLKRAQSAPNLPGGIWFVDLSESTDLETLVHTLAQVMGIPLKSCKTTALALTRLGDAMHHRGRCWMILDNLEQVSSAAAQAIKHLRIAAPETKLLLTSREPSGVDDEFVIRLDGLAKTEATALFIDRAKTVQPEFEPDEATLNIIARIVEAVDRNPLAIELAAARVRLLSPGEIETKLRDALQFLAVRNSDRPERHRTLQATIDWSWNLLTPWEQATLAQCAVFQDGFTVEAAESVIELSDYPEAPWLLDILEALADHSLLQRATPSGLPGENRVYLLKMVQQFAEEKLNQNPLLTNTRHHHATWAVRYGERLQKAIITASDAKPTTRFFLEQANLNAAVTHANSNDWNTAIDATLLLCGIFRHLGPSRKAVELLHQAKPHATEHRLIDLLIWTARFHMQLGQNQEAKACLEEAHLRNQEIPTKQSCAHIARFRGEAAYELGDFDSAHHHLTEAMHLYRQRHDASGEGRVLTMLGTMHRLQGKLSEAGRNFSQALVLLEDAKDHAYESVAWAGKGATDLALRRTDDAFNAYEQALRINEALQRHTGISHVLENRGNLRASLGQVEAAKEDLNRALESARQRGAKAHEAAVLMNLGTLHADMGSIDRAERYYRAALILHKQHKRPLYEGYTLACLGRLTFENGQLEIAESQLSSGLGLLNQVSATHPEAMFKTVRAAVRWAAGDDAGAKVDHSEAHTVFAHLADPIGLTLCDLASCHGALDRAPAAIEKAQNTDPANSTHPKSATAPSAMSVEVRVAIRILDHRLR